MRTLKELWQDIGDSISLLQALKSERKNLMNEYGNPMNEKSQLKSTLGSLGTMLGQAVQMSQGNYAQIISEIEARRASPPSDYEEVLGCGHTRRQHDDHAYESAQRQQETQKPREKSIFELPAPAADILAPFGTWLQGRIDFWSDVQFEAEYESPDASEAEAIYNLLEEVQARFNRGVDLVASYANTSKMVEYLSEDVSLAEVDRGQEKSEAEINSMLSERLTSQDKDGFKVYLKNLLHEYSAAIDEEGYESLPHAVAIHEELAILLYEYDRRRFELEETVTVVTVTTTRRRYYDGRGSIPPEAKTPRELHREYGQKLREERGMPGSGDPFAEIAEQLRTKYGDRVSFRFVGGNPFKM